MLEEYIKARKLQDERMNENMNKTTVTNNQQEQNNEGVVNMANTTTEGTKCTRCAGTGIYQQYGECFRCKGTGNEPITAQGIQTTQQQPVANMTTLSGEVTKEAELIIFNQIVSITEAKGGQKKMTSIFSIRDNLQKEEHILTTRIFIESVLDILIRRRYVRYFRNDKGYMYYGATPDGWNRWFAHQAQEALQEEIATTENPDMTTPYDLEMPPETPISNLSPAQLEQVKQGIEKKWATVKK